MTRHPNPASFEKSGIGQKAPSAKRHIKKDSNLRRVINCDRVPVSTKCQKVH